jgi:hypothetical protein
MPEHSVISTDRICCRPTGAPWWLPSPVTASSHQQSTCMGRGTTNGACLTPSSVPPMLRRRSSCAADGGTVMWSALLVAAGACLVDLRYEQWSWRSSFARFLCCFLLLPYYGKNRAEAQLRRVFPPLHKASITTPAPTPTSPHKALSTTSWESYRPTPAIVAAELELMWPAPWPPSMPTNTHDQICRGQP